MGNGRLYMQEIADNDQAVCEMIKAIRAQYIENETDL
jgi:hypothetical protein